MATIQKGTVSTTEVLADSMVIDMRDEVSMADEDTSQFSTYTMKSAKQEATREKVNWREKDYFPRLATVAEIYDTDDTAWDVSSGHGNRIRVGDVLKNMATRESMYVTAVSTDTVTVVRGVGAVAAAAGAVGDTLLIASNASPQGADFPTTAILVGTLGYNYTQIFRHGYTFSRTARAVNYYGRSEPDQESALKLVEHKRAIEYSGFWGARDSMTDPNTGEPVGFAGGLDEFIVSHRTDVGGAPDLDDVDIFLQATMQKSSRNSAIYFSPLAARMFSRLNRTGQGSAWKPEPSNVLGLKIDAFVSGAYGYQIPAVVKKDWNDFPTTLKQFGGWMFVVDHDRVVYRPLVGADTALLTPRQHPGGDRVSEEYLTECTWEIRNEGAHGILYGITA